MKRCKLWLFFPLIILFLFALRLHYRERSLLERATILDTKRPHHQNFESISLPLFDDKILFIDYTEKGYSARLRDVKTGQDKPYKGKGTFFGNRSIDDTIFRLSPDRKRLLWVSNGEVLATDANGTELGKWNRQLGQAMYIKEWMPDSLHWVEAIEKSNGTYAQIHGIGEPDKPEQKISGLGNGWFFGFTSRKTLLTVDTENSTNFRGQYQISEFSLGGKIKPRTISLPSSPVSVSELVISPQGDRLAWITKDIQQNTFQRLSERLGLGAGRYESVYKLWTSNSDGKQIKKIGTIVVVPLFIHNDEVDSPSDLEWLPNGKQVSFYYKDKLYAVSVE